jgi:hypothetical protein
MTVIVMSFFSKVLASLYHLNVQKDNQWIILFLLCILSRLRQGLRELQRQALVAY